LSLTSDYEFRVRAVDGAGNWSPWKEVAAPLDFRVVSDRSSSITYKGTWKRAAVASATNLVRTTSTATGATASYQFTGRGIALVMPRSSVRGRVTIYIDGVNVAVVDTYSRTVQARRVVFHKTWASAGTHRITVRVNGTSGRRTVSIDGFVVLL
ncbi:MAG TPA: hypothetical protein VD763_02240, partial [Candidatus Saccharimonadales bacterium]|nr:hypothetical protein [Candidatus Saccharimonadales bacterium]